jgi:DNA-binding transcriptional regulator YiaG
VTKNPLIENALEAMELRPTELAAALGVTYDTYVQWQSGRRSHPLVSTALSLLLILHEQGYDIKSIEYDENGKIRIGKTKRVTKK